MKNTWTILILAVVIIGGVWWLNSGSSSIVPTASVKPTSVAVITATPKKIIIMTATPTPVARSYTQLVADFGSRRIQFDQNCQADPKSFVLKNGTTVMLDNRSNQNRTISVDGTQYAVAAYGYQVVTLTSPTLPKDLGLGCNSSVNVSTIKLQASIAGE